MSGLLSGEEARMSEGAKVQDYTSCRYGGAHEAIQEASDHSSHNDSPYFNFMPPGETPIAGAVIRIGMRPNDGYSEASVVMPRSDGTSLFHYVRSPLARGDFAVGSRVWESGPLTIEAVEPTRRWRLSYAGDDMRLVRDREAFGERPGEIWRASDPVRCEFELDWEAAFPIHVLSADGHELPGDGDVAYGRDHYEQFGRVSGRLRIGDSEWGIDEAPSFRDHSWGPRVWERHPDQDFVSAYLDDGRHIVAIANREDGREDAHGVIWSPGGSRPIQIERYEIRTDYAGEPSPAERIGWTFEGENMTVDVEGRVIGFLPLRVGSPPVRIAQTILSLDGEHPGCAKADLTRPIAG
jgi:hypothetical protein